MSLESVSQLGWFRGHWLHSTFCAKLDLCQVFCCRCWAPWLTVAALES